MLASKADRAVAFQGAKSELLEDEQIASCLGLCQRQHVLLHSEHTCGLHYLALLITNCLGTAEEATPLLVTIPLQALHALVRITA